MLPDRASHTTIRQPRQLPRSAGGLASKGKVKPLIYKKAYKS